MGKVTVEHEPPYMTDEVWKVRVGGRLIGLTRDKATADLLSGAEDAREALRACLEALRTVGDNPRVMETMVIPQDAERVRAAIATARAALGLEVSE